MTIPKFSKFTIFLAKVLWWVVRAIITLLIWDYLQSLIGRDERMPLLLLSAVYQKKKEKEISDTAETQVNQEDVDISDKKMNEIVPVNAVSSTSLGL